jgi:hypothetical protein
LHPRCCHGFTSCQQLLQGFVNPDLTFVGRQVQDLHIFPTGTIGLPLQQGIVGHAETAGRKQVGLVAILGKRPRLAHQPVDHVTVIDAMLVPAPQPRHLEHEILPIPHLHDLRRNPSLHPFADQTRRYRIQIPLYRNRRPSAHLHAHALERFQTPPRQRPQHPAFLGQPLLPTGVLLRTQVAEKLLILCSTGKVPAATQQEHLLQRAFELVMALFGIAVLVAAAGIDRLATHPVVTQQGAIALREPFGVAILVDRQAHAIRTMLVRHSAQLPEGILQAGAEALEAFAETDADVFPVRIGQHKVVDQVGKRHAHDRHVQTGQMGEIRGAELSGFVLLGEEHFPIRPLRGAPIFDPSLQRAQLAVLETSRITPLQVRKQRLGFQSRGQFQEALDLGPDLDKRIRPRRPVMFPSSLAGQLPTSILACCLAIHPCLQRCHGQRRLLL